MKNTRRKVITVESRTQTIIRRGGTHFSIRCDICGSESVSVLPEGTDEDQMRRFEAKLRSGTCVDDMCRRLLEADTLPQFLSLISEARK